VQDDRTPIQPPCRMSSRLESGDVLVKGFFKENAPKIMALPSSSLVKQALIFKANPRIKRVVFVASPHRGGPVTTRQQMPGLVPQLQSGYCKRMNLATDGTPSLLRMNNM